jgi:DNA-binding transcriptional LysR family regulator
MFVRANHPLARKKSVKLSDMLNQPMIIRGGKGISGTTEKALKQLCGQGLGINIVLRCDDPQAVKAAVRQRMGVGIALEDTVKAGVKSGEFKMLNVPDLELAGESFIIYSRKRPLSPLAQEFLELLRSARQKTETPKLAAQRSAESCYTSQTTSRRTSPVV